MVEPIRALLVEMADALDHDRQCLMDDRRLTHPLADRARAVLAAAQGETGADGPAVPEGREPASVAEQPSDEELLKLMPESMREEFSHAELLERHAAMQNLAADAVSALRYIELTTGRLHGVGWDRVFDAAATLQPAHALQLPALQGGEVEP